MLKFLVILVGANLSLSLWAKEIESRIYKIELLPPEKEALIKFENGEVGFLDTTEASLLDELKDAQKKQVNVIVEVNRMRSIKAFSKRNSHQNENTFIMRKQEAEFEPTVFTSLDDVKQIFYEMRRDWQNASQCYNRAHVWAYEAFDERNLNSMKLFMFFTSSYIRKYRYKWWFHVSPMTYLKENTTISPMILDRRYSSSPLRRKTWSNMFIYSKRECPLISSYSYYENNQKTEHCYHIPVSMYFWQPRDIERFEQYGTEKKTFLIREVNWAYREAF